jgi:hypothetical protein
MAFPTDPSRLQALLRATSEIIRGVTGQVLSTVVGDVITVQPEFSFTYGIRNPSPRAVGDVIYLPERPVTVVAMTVDAVSFTGFSFNAEGVVWRTDGLWWNKAATITYDHGYAETSSEMQEIKSIVIDAATRAYTLNERGSGEAFGMELMESRGFAPAIFLLPNEMMRLDSFSAIGVG